MLRVLRRIVFFLGTMTFIFCAGIAIGRAEFLLRDSDSLITSIAELPFGYLLQDFFLFAIGPALAGFAALTVWSFRVSSTYRRAFAILALGFISFDLAGEAILDLGAIIFGYNIEDLSASKPEEFLTAHGLILSALLIAFFLVLALLMFAYPVKAMFIRRRSVQIALFILIVATVLFIHDMGYLTYRDSSEPPFDTMPIDQKRFVMQWLLMQQYIILLLIAYVFSKTAGPRKSPIEFKSDVIFNTSITS
jgi:hypothetical protein